MICRDIVGRAGILLILLVCIAFDIQGQTIKGRIFMADTGLPVAAATVSAWQDSVLLSSVQSNEKGFYLLGLERSGSYLFTFSYENHSNTITVDLLQNTTLNIDVYPEMEVHELDNVTIYEDIYHVGDLTMTQKQFKTMPASFQDPSRILMRYPGFSTSHDGANSIVYRGMPPESVRWQLFGADIVNPNHLANAGTANDLTSNNAGGVNALNGAVLDYYHFEASPARVAYGNVMSGISDMKMASSMQPYLDFNLIGLEAGMGAKVGDKHIYASYRQSFTGLLNRIGVDFGNEKIGYQDLSAYADLINNDKSHLKLFMTLGESHNYYTGIDTTSQPVAFKDIQQITYKSQLGIVGSQFTWQQSKFVYQSTLIASARKDGREEFTLDYFKQTTGFDHSDIQNIQKKLLSWHNQFKWQLSGKDVTAGLRTNYHVDHAQTNALIAKQDFVSIYPYAQIENSRLEKWHYVAGMGVMYDDETGEITAEPAISLDWRASEKLTFGVAYRLSSLQDYTDRRYIIAPYKPDRIKSSHVQLNSQYVLPTSSVGVNVFYSQLWDVAKFIYEGQERSYTSAFNGGNLGYDQLLSPIWIPDGTGKARTYGIEGSMQSKFSFNKHSWILDVNSSVFNATYRNRSAQRITGDYDGRYNYGTISNISVSYQLHTVKNEQQRKWIISFASHVRGGQYEPYIDTRADSREKLYLLNSRFYDQNPNYSRADFRVVYDRKKNTKRLRQIWSIDIQNVLNNKEVLYRYHDFLQKKIVNQQQLGILPVLSYRLVWE